jgi:hypothetical protein
MEILIESVSPDAVFSLVIDEDRGVGYAYLKYQGRMVAHAWLYNRDGTPELPVDADPDAEPPFKNSRAFAREPDFALPDGDDSFLVEWAEPGSDPVVELRIGGLPVARFFRGKRVGQSRLAVVENKLAVPLDVGIDA